MKRRDNTEKTKLAKNENCKICLQKFTQHVAYYHTNAISILNKLDEFANLPEMLTPLVTGITETCGKDDVTDSMLQLEKTGLLGMVIRCYYSHIHH